MSIGAKVIIVLGALTMIEYIIAITAPVGRIPIILVIAVAKALLIVIYFMHVGQIWRGDRS